MEIQFPFAATLLRVREPTAKCWNGSRGQLESLCRKAIGVSSVFSTAVTIVMSTSTRIFANSSTIGYPL